MTWTIAGRKRIAGKFESSGLTQKIRLGHGIVTTGPVTIIFESDEDNGRHKAARLIADDSVQFQFILPETAEEVIAEALKKKLEKKAAR